MTIDLRGMKLFEEMQSLPQEDREVHVNPEVHLVQLAQDLQQGQVYPANHQYHLCPGLLFVQLVLVDQTALHVPKNKPKLDLCGLSG